MEGKRIVLRSLNRTEQDVQIYKREDIILEKGVALTEQYLTSIQQLLERYMNFFTAYPDLYLDIIAPQDAQIKLFPYQRVFLRAIMRFKNVYVTACRAFSKSFITILGMVLQCIFMPGTKRFIVAPHKNQAASIAKQKIEEIYHHWPILKKEIIGWELNDIPGNFGKDYVTLKFKNGSQFDVVGGDGARGLRRHGGLLDEARDLDEVNLQEVIIPLMNISRHMPDNTINPKEPNQQQIFATSASTKSSYAYMRLIECLEDSIINPEYAFVMGCDYRVPALHGLISKSYINSLKMSPTFDENAFTREYLSNWTSASDESWFNFDKLEALRVLKNPEWHARDGANENQFYLLSVDVGRLRDSSVVSVFRVQRRGSGQLLSSLVNVIVIGRTAEKKTFSAQALDIKKLIEKYQPKEVVIDCNGLTYQVM